jgi:dynein heavy chain, axonemal
MNSATVFNIYHTILSSFLSQNTNLNMGLAIESIVNIALSIFQKFQKELLPTPKNCHYIFSCRDLSKLFNGILKINLNHINGFDELITLFTHELTRVFYDRILNPMH